MQNFDVNKLRVASPCSVGWEEMIGDERVRNCHVCQLNIYNTVEMTNDEVRHLIENREGRLCIRMYQRSDGTVLTKDCPVGLRAVRKRIGLVVGAAMSAILGLFSISFAQKEPLAKDRSNQIVIERINVEGQQSKLYGSICDQHGAIISRARVILLKKGEKKPLETVANEDGEFTFTGLSEGIYRFEASASGFKTNVKKNIRIGRQENISIVAYLGVYSTRIGIFID